MPKQKPAASNDNQVEADDSRGEVTLRGGNKIRGDDLKGAIDQEGEVDEPARHKQR